MPVVIHRRWSPPILAPAPVYLDTSVVLGWLSKSDPLYPRAVQFIGDHLVAKVGLQVSLLVLDEMLWQLARRMVAKATGIRPEQVRLGQLLKRNPKYLATYLPGMKSAVDYVLTWANLVAAPPAKAKDVVESWFDRMGELGQIHDSLHVSLAQFAGAKSLATGDRGFRLLRTLPVAFQVVEL